jgi:hypothetical protein
VSKGVMSSTTVWQETMWFASVDKSEPCDVGWLKSAEHIEKSILQTESTVRPGTGSMPEYGCRIWHSRWIDDSRHAKKLPNVSVIKHVLIRQGANLLNKLPHAFCRNLYPSLFLTELIIEMSGNCFQKRLSDMR